MNKLSYSEVIALASEIKKISGQIEDIIANLNDQDYIRIGDNGDVWTGDAANVANRTFEELSSKYSKFLSTTNECADYLVNIVAQR